MTNTDEPNSDPRVITGVAASPGTVTGKATVAHTMVEAAKLQAGDVLVCEQGMGIFTTLFSMVVAVVADSGSYMGEAARTARKMGLPCVVGTRIATSTITDGQTITVDGDRGIVRIES